MCNVTCTSAPRQGRVSARSSVRYWEVVPSSVMTTVFIRDMSCSGEAGAELPVQARVHTRLSALTFS